MVWDADVFDAKNGGECYNFPYCGGYSSVAERRSVAADVVGSKPTSRPKHPFPSSVVRAAIAGVSACGPRTVDGRATLVFIVVPTPAESSSYEPRLFAGTSGWAYPTWKPGFYPAKTPAKKFLEFYATRLNAVEVNYTFRALPTAKMLTEWLAATPATFRFSFKAPQRITHFSRLVGCAAQVEQFLAALEPVRAAGRLGPLLFQLPPNFKADTERLEGFLELAALRGKQAPRLAFEFRHESWFHEATYEVLRRHDAAMCVAEGDDLLTPEVHTAAHRCFRLRRGGGYSAIEVDAFAARIAPLTSEGPVYVFFRHEDEPTGALNAEAFLRAAGVGRECGGGEVTASRRAEGVLKEFTPRRFLRNGHLQTIAGNFLPRVDTLPKPEAVLVEVEPATAGRMASRVLCHCHWQAEAVRAGRPTVVIVHGLEGSSSSQYVIGNANKFWQAGCNVVRMNMRNCGGTERMSPTLYHSGLSGDVLAVMQFFVARVWVGVGGAGGVFDGRQPGAEAGGGAGWGGAGGAACGGGRVAGDRPGAFGGCAA